MIMASVSVICLESVAELRALYGAYFLSLDWAFALLFAAEYLVRVYCSPERKRYVLSTMGVIDLLSILPTFISPFVAGAQSLIVVRALRLLRVFRVMKLAHFESEGQLILRALRASRYKVFVFTCSIMIIVVIMGTLMYLVEGKAGGFDHIPRGIYWAIVTLTTVGYGDITPKSGLGQVLSSALMVMGYAIIAVPTGIVTSAIAEQQQAQRRGRVCARCGLEEHARHARFCHRCGHAL